MKKYDLTSNKDIQRIVSDFGMNPLNALAKYALDKITDFSNAWNTQRDVATRLIKEGKEHGVKEMEITINNTRGLKFNIPMDDVKIDTVVGADEKMHIKVKYK